MSTQKSGYCTLCRSRCGTLNTIHNDALIRVEPDTSHPTGQAMCPKGRAAPELVHSPHRSLHPMRRTTPKGSADPGWEQITWDQAFEEIATRFSQIRDESGAEAVAFGVTTPSGTPLSDSIDWIERFIRAFGSPNIAYGTEVCNWHKDHAHAFTFGCGIPVADYQHADLIMLWGHNPTNTWLAQANAIAEGRRGGARLLVVDPRRTALAAEADGWLQVKPGTDAALALGLVNLLLMTERYDHEFVRNWTNAPLLVRSDTGKFLRAGDLQEGAQDPDAWMVWDHESMKPVLYDTRYTAHAQGAATFALRGEYEVQIKGRPTTCHPVLEKLARRCASYSPAHVEAITGVAESALEAAADLISQSSAVAYHAWSGIAQSTNATQTERAVAILYALTGSFDTPGGNRQYGKHPSNQVNGLDLIPDAQRAKALGLKERPLGPPVMGWIAARDLYQAILTAKPYQVRAFMGFGTNQLASQGDVSMAQAAYQALEFHVHCDLFETPTAKYADIFLPVNTPWEREGLRIGFEISPSAQELVQLRPQMVTSRGSSRSDNDIVFELACRLGMSELFFDGQLERGWDHQLAPLGITVSDLRHHKDGSIRRPLEHRDRKYSQPLQADANGGLQNGVVRGFDTQTRRVELYSELLFRHDYDPLPHHDQSQPLLGHDDKNTYPYTLTSAKSGYYCHSQHRALVSLRKRLRMPEAIINASVAASKDIQAGDWVRITTPAGTARFVATLDEHVAREVIFADYGWWQACSEIGEPAYPIHGTHASNYNALIDADKADPISGSVPMRHFPCSVELDVKAEPSQRPWPGLRTFHVGAMQHVADGVLELALSPQDGGALPDYRPGQHITLELTLDGNRSLTRTYSLIGPAQCSARKTYRIAVRRQRGKTQDGQDWEGVISGHLHSKLHPGSTVRVAAPGGSFILPERSRQPVVLFAGGIGITPFLSYLESLLDADDTPEVWLHYANRNSLTKAYGDRLHQLSKQLPRLNITDYYSDPLATDYASGEMPGAHVVPDALIEKRARFYMCGPPAMMDAIRQGLQNRNVPSFDIFSEVFRSPAVVDLDSAGPFDVRFARSDNTKAQWTAEAGTLLSFGEKLGLDMPSGCRVGQCESCAVRIVSGQVRHLHGAEPDDPSVCLACQAIPITDVVLDV